jgi:tRNA dimethylallyltransferase
VVDSALDFVALVGPTAVGKSALALRWAGEAPIEIVNADALQAYRRLEIGTGKPSAAERERVRHHLVDILDPVQSYSAGEFARRAADACAEIRSRGRLPLVVGGSGLYFRALRDGLSTVPPVDPAVRREIEASGDTARLYGELRRLDPEGADRLAPADRHRIVRALEVVRSTGRSLSEWWRATGTEPKRALAFGLTLPRALLYDRIARRVAAMAAAGWQQEVSVLLSQGVSFEAPAFQAIGYRQWVKTLVEGRDTQQTIEEIVLETRRYAKRQETWFRKERGITWLDSTERDVMSQVPAALAEVLRGRAREG